MLLTLPKSLLKGVDRHHLILKEKDCSASENRTHFFMQTLLTGCKTQLRHRDNFAIYSNMVTEIPLKQDQTVTRVRDVTIPFRCFYSELGVASSIGIKPVSKKVILSSRGMGKFTLTLDLFKSTQQVFCFKYFFPIKQVTRFTSPLVARSCVKYVTFYRDLKQRVQKCKNMSRDYCFQITFFYLLPQL